jgi:hypothetical protein
MKKIVPFVITGLLSSVFTLWVSMKYLGIDDIGLLKVRADIAVEEQKKLSDRVEKIMFTKAGAFRFPDLTNSHKEGTYLGKVEILPVIDYR